MYNDLIEQYEKLTEEEKNILLIYKSRLGRAINDLDNNEEEIIDIYRQYRRLVSNPKNIFMAYTVFKDINFETIEQFKESLKFTKEHLEKIMLKIKIPEDITVYRALSIKQGEQLKSLAKTNIISTSFNINECSKFLIMKENFKHYLYQINLSSLSPVAICPYSILIDEKEDRLILNKRKDQQEVILSKDYYDFTTELETKTTLGNELDLNIIIVNAYTKEIVKDKNKK